MEGAAPCPQQPRKLGTCQAPTCLSSLLSTRVLTSSPDSPCRWLTHSTCGVTRAEAAYGSLCWYAQPLQEGVCVQDLGKADLGA